MNVRAAVAMSESSARPEGPEFLDEAGLNRIRWRCRRGLLENDLFIERFFSRHGSRLTHRHADALMVLMDLADNDLLDLLLGRQEPKETLETQELREVLAMLRTPQ